MRIGFPINDLMRHGSVRRVVELSNRLIRRGHEVVIFNQRGDRCDWIQYHALIRPVAAKRGLRIDERSRRVNCR